MLPGPVFNVELLTLARRTRYYVLRTVYGLLLLLLIWQNDPALYRYSGASETGEISIQQMAMLGMSLFWTFAATQSIVVLLITPALVAGVIADERQRKTLHFLLSSQLSSAEIVLGKLAARILHVSVFLAMGLPIVALLPLFGGVDPNWVLLFFAATATTMFLLAAGSILVSTYARKPRDAVVTVYMLELVWLFAPSLVQAVARGIGGRWRDAYELIHPVNEWIGASSPMYVLTSLAGPSSVVSPPIVWMMVLQLAFGAAFEGLAVWRLRPAFRKEGTRSWFIFRVLRQRAGRLLPRPACGNDAMLWKEMHVAKTSPMTKIVGCLVLALVGLLIAYTTSSLVIEAYRELCSAGYGTGIAENARQNLNGFLRFLLTLIASFMLVWVACAASSGLTSEREQDTWVSLIVTPLTAEEILRAKMVGAFWSLRLLLALWIGFLVIGLVLGAVHPLGAVAVVIVTATYLAFGCALGTFYSLRARTSARAVTATIATLIFVNGAYLILVTPFGMGSSLWAIGVTPFVEAVALLSYNDVDALFVVTSYAWRDDIVATCIVSTVLYGLSAIFLAMLTLGSFDDVFDRPNSDSWDAARRRVQAMRTAYAKGLPASGKATERPILELDEDLG
jgi:ABC-type transport system involved in multi-copper enzyme maturation permease subunit